MQLSDALQLDYLGFIEGESLAVAMFRNSQVVLNILNGKSVFAKPQSVGDPMILEDGSFITNISQVDDLEQTFEQTFRDFSTAAIKLKLNEYIQWPLGIIDTENIFLFREEDTHYIASIDFRRGSIRKYIEMQPDEELIGRVGIYEGQYYVKTISFDGVTFRNLKTGIPFLRVSGVSDVIIHHGMKISRSVTKDGVVRIYVRDLKDRLIFSDKFGSHFPLVWICNQQSTSIAVIGTHKAIYTLPQFDCIYSNPNCRGINISKCGHFAGVRLADQLGIINLDEQTIAYSLELERFWSHFEILPGGNLVLFDNRGVSDEKFEWKLVRNPNGSE